MVNTNWGYATEDNSFGTHEFLKKMTKKIMILNGSPRKNGKTASLVKAFVEGAKSAGHEVKEMYIDGMNIASCKACEYCQNKGKGNCIQQDDMAQVYDGFVWADVIVFASPQYWGGRTLAISLAQARSCKHRCLESRYK